MATPQNRASTEDLSTKITMAVFWGLVLAGMGFTGLLLYSIEEDTIERRNEITDSIAYKIALARQHQDPESISTVSLLRGSVMPLHDLGIEIYRNGQLFTYMGKQFSADRVDTIIRPLFFISHKDSVYELHVLFPRLDEVIHTERKRSLMALGSLLLIFGVLLKGVLERLLKKPIDRMVETAQAVSAGEVNVSFDEQRKDELGYLASFINEAIDKLHKQEQVAWKAKELAEITLESISDGVVTTDKEGRVVFMNSSAERMSRRNFDDENGKPLAEVIPLVNGEAGDLSEHPVYKCLSDNISVDIKANCALIMKNGSQLAISCSLAPIHDNEGNVLGVVMVFHDMSEAQALHRELSYQATHDHLTGLYNRRELEHELQHSLVLVHRDSVESALCYIDLDKFKVVNDTCGHAAGDMLLRSLAEYLNNMLRKTDIFARLGGDEFALLLPKCTIAEARKVSANILKAINDFSFTWRDKQFQIGASIGVAHMTSESKNAAEVLANADMACYTAKEAGRNRVHIYRPEDQKLKKR